MTDCLDPMSPTNEVLLYYALDGEPLSDEAKKHLDDCPLCKQRVALYAGVNASLISNLYRSQCPPLSQLIDYCTFASLHLLTDEEYMSIAKHMHECPLCTAEIAHLNTIISPHTSSI